MADAETPFKRIVISLPHNPQDYTAVSTTARLAKQLGVDLVGTLFEDASLPLLADLPEAREFRAMTSWQPLSAEQLTTDFARLVAEAQRMFTEIIDQHQTGGNFRCARGSAAQAMLHAHASDIVAVVDPRNPLERITRQFRELVDIIFDTAASVFIVPSAPAVTSGQLVVIGAHPGDPAIAVATAIAASTKEPLTIIPLEQPSPALIRTVERARQTGVRAAIAEPIHRGADLAALTLMSRNLKGKLLITNRQYIAKTDRSLSLQRAQIPLLLISSVTSLR